MVHFLTSDLDDTLLVGEGKKQGQGPPRRGSAGNREGKGRDGQGQRRIGDYLRLPWAVGQLNAVMHPTHMGNAELFLSYGNIVCASFDS